MIAHINKEGKEESVAEHCKKTALIAKQIGAECKMESSAELSAILHDTGKGTCAFFEYITTVTSKDGIWRKEKLNHSSAGGKYLIESFPVQSVPGKLTEQMVAWSIMSHHGLNDMVTIEKVNNFKKRMNPQKEIYYEEAVENFERNSPCEVKKLLRLAQTEVTQKVQQIKKVTRKVSEIDFMVGMLVRLNLSILIDADRTATAEFMHGISLRKNWNQTELWPELEAKLNQELKTFPEEGNLAKLRRKISEECLQAGGNPESIYTLQVPTGGGKTLSGMRFALRHAKKYDKQRVFYVAPYKTILEQNAEVYRNIFGDEVVLEYHSDLIVEQESQEYQTLTENFGAPVVLTTMVQFLNSLFSNQTQCIRRMHSFANAVIVLDEVQSIPVHMVNLFNGAINFLKICCGSTVVLCSATQPLFGKTSRPMYLGDEIISNVSGLSKAFKRNSVIDRTDLHSCEEIAALAMRNLEKSESGLVIVNTKKAARQIYDQVRKQNSSEIVVFHLSTNMCPACRMDIFEEFKKQKEDHKKVLCISTQLIEAGVDISVDFVIRSLAGWDSILQAAGRCNRNAENDNGNVYLVKCDEEDLSRLKSIREGRAQAIRILDEFRREPELYLNDLLSAKTVEKYYEYYYFSDADKKYKMDYEIPEYGSTIYEMLSTNYLFAGREKDLYLRQSFREAGKKFQAIDADTRGIIVPYQAGKEIIELLNSDIDYEEAVRILQRAQRVTVNVYESTFCQMEKEGIISKLHSCDAYYLKECYFDEELGFVEDLKILHRKDE